MYIHEDAYLPQRKIGWVLPVHVRRLRGLTRRLGYSRTQRIGIMNCGRISTVSGVCLDWDWAPKLCYPFSSSCSCRRPPLSGTSLPSSLAPRTSPLPFLPSSNPIRHHGRSLYLEGNIRQHWRDVRTLDTNSNQFVSLPSHPIDTAFESVCTHLPSTSSVLCL